MKNIDFKSVPNCLRKYRKAAGLKQKDVARILKLKSASMISRWEKGVCLPGLINAIRLSCLYCVLLDALFFPLVRAVKTKIMQRLRENEKH